MAQVPSIEIVVRPSVAREFPLLVSRYGTTKEDFIQACLTFVSLVVSAKPPALPAPPLKGPPSRPQVAEGGGGFSPAPAMPVVTEEEAAAEGVDEGDEASEAESLEEPVISSRSVLDDLGQLMFPHHAASKDFHRIAGMLEDLTLQIRQAQLSIEAFRPAKNFGVPRPNTAGTTLPESATIIQDTSL